MTCVFYLTDVFQLVINGFNKSALSKHDFIVHKHQSVLHVLLYLGYRMYAVHKKLFEQVFGNTGFIIDYQILFKTIEPADRAWSFPRDPFECTVLLFSLDMTAAKWRGVNE